MEENTLSDSVISALTLLKRVHRLSGSVAILHGKLIHAEVSLKAFSSERFTQAVQSVFDGFAQRKRRAQRVAMVFEGQNLVLIGQGPMIVGFFFENLSDLETVEAGISRFIEQFGSALQMDEPEPEVAEIEPVVKSVSAENSRPYSQPKPAATTRPVIAGSSKILKKIEIDDDESEASETEEVDEIEAPTSHSSRIFRKILPQSIAATMTAEEVLAGISDRRIRKMIENEISESV